MVDSLAAKIRGIVATSLGIAEDAVGDTQDIFTELNGDDLDRLEITMAVEEAFRLDFSDAQVEACRTVAHFAALVARMTGGADALA